MKARGASRQEIQKALDNLCLKAGPGLSTKTGSASRYRKRYN